MDSPVTLAAVVTLFAAEKLDCVATAAKLPHERFPDVSVINACPPLEGTAVGKTSLYVDPRVVGVVNETVLRTLLAVLCSRNWRNARLADMLSM